MNRRVIVLTLALLAFAALTGWAIYSVGYFGIWAAGFAGPGAIQVLADLATMGTLAILWMLVDARRQALNPWPYVVITVLAGSFGPLLYLLRREWRRQPGPAGAA